MEYFKDLFANNQFYPGNFESVSEQPEPRENFPSFSAPSNSALIPRGFRADENTSRRAPASLLPSSTSHASSSRFHFNGFLSEMPLYCSLPSALAAQGNDHLGSVTTSTPPPLFSGASGRVNAVLPPVGTWMNAKTFNERGCALNCMCTVLLALGKAYNVAGAYETVREKSEQALPQWHLGKGMFPEEIKKVLATFDIHCEIGKQTANWEELPDFAIVGVKVEAYAHAVVFRRENGQAFILDANHDGLTRPEQYVLFAGHRYLEIPINNA